jgi:hypothetical protein
MSHTPRTRLSLVSPALAFTLAARHVRALGARFACADALPDGDPSALAHAIFARVLPEGLVLALEEIERLATVIGREAILEAARGRADDVPLWSRDTPTHLAARLVLASYRKDARGDVARAIVKRARVRVARYFSPRASYEVVAKLPVERAAALLAAAREVHGAGLVDAWTVTHGDVVYGAFVHEGLAESVVRARDGATTARTVRPHAVDRVRCDAARGRIGFLLARPAQLPEWTCAVGRAAYGDSASIARRPAFTLRAPHERGAAWLSRAPLPPSLRAVAAVGCELDDGSRLSARSPTALADLHERLAARGGYLVRLTLRFELRDGAQTDATIELPRKLTLPDARFEDDVRAALDALQLTSPGVLADDLGSLAPFEHAAWRWGEVLGERGFDDAVKAGLLVRGAASRRASDAAHRSYGSSLILHDLDGEETKYALGEDLSVHAYDVSPESTARWTLDTARFAATLAARLRLTEMKLKRAAPPGLLPIGRLETKAGHACIFQLMRLVRDAEAGDVREALRLACGTAHPVVLLGKGRTLGKGTAQIEVEPSRLFAEDDLGDLVAAIAEAIGIEDELPPSRYASENTPLVILREKGEAWYGRVRLLLTANQFAMLAGLARTPGEWVSASELGEMISRNAGQPDVVVRRARMGFEARIVKSFARAKFAMPAGLAGKLVEVDRGLGRYRLGVGVVVR